MHATECVNQLCSLGSTVRKNFTFQQFISFWKQSQIWLQTIVSLEICFVVVFKLCFTTQSGEAAQFQWQKLNCVQMDGNMIPL